MSATRVDDLTLGKYLKIVSQSGVYGNLNEDARMWDFIKKHQKSDTQGRELRYSLRSSYGAAAAGFVPVNGGALPGASQSSLLEGITQYKDFALTIEVERTLIEKALSDFAKYGEPLAEEIRAKTIVMSRILSAGLYGDGTGVHGTALNAGSVVGGQTVFNASSANTARGFIGWINFGDKVVITEPDGTTRAPTLSSGTFDHYVVVDRDLDANTLTLSARSSANVALTVTATNVVAGDLVYRSNQTTKADLSSAPSSSVDYNSLSEYWVGLDSFVKGDNRLVNNINLTGAIKGSAHDAGGNPIDSSDFQKVMSKIMVNVGQGRYKYDAAIMGWATYDALIESRETDRRFQSIQDSKRGVASLGYVHGKNTLMFEPDEFCPPNRVYIVPNGDVLQFHGRDFKFIEPQKGQKFHLRPNASGYDRTIQAFMDGQGALMCVHNAALGVITNFTA